MLRINKQGFTLIELMVVIVIIGVLASLAIPRFTEASAKAKMAEAPRVLASYESAMLAAVAELSKNDLANLMEDDLVFEIPESKWFTYAFGPSSSTDADGNSISIPNAGACKATAKSGMGSFAENDWIESKYVGAKAAGTDDQGNATAAEKDKFDHTTNNDKATKKMIPNFGAVKGQ